VAQSLIKQMCH